MSDGEQSWYVFGYVVGGLLWGVLATIYQIDVWQVVVCVPVGAVVAKVWYWWRRRRDKNDGQQATTPKRAPVHSGGSHE